MTDITETQMSDTIRVVRVLQALPYGCAAAAVTVWFRGLDGKEDRGVELNDVLAALETHREPRPGYREAGHLRLVAVDGKRVRKPRQRRADGPPAA